MHGWRLAFCISSCLIIGVSGCGSDYGKPATVTGKVTVDGQPLGSAIVALHCTGNLPAEMRTVRATTDGSGNYTITKVYPGSYMAVVVEQNAGNADGAQAAHAENNLRPVDGDELRVEVNAPTLTFNLQLTRAKKKSH